ncbi:MAG TPA: rifamycin-inactivating phosphotransferase [Longimicrobiales bacterium]|nr:rifamycin-inactivating phosphotransferase [Longimicrobiales bacterium]
MAGYVQQLEELDREHVALVGGKAAQLGELARIDGIRVPAGFCVTTDAFRRVIAGAPAIAVRIAQLAQLAPADQQAARELAADLRRAIEATPIPDDVARTILRALETLGERVACAVRSSATAEDLPTASFAGQQDTFLNVVGPDAILERVRQCWASLFTERAVTYRMRNGFDHRAVRMAVIVQRMVEPDGAGVLFTADPVNGNRTITAIEACYGLGEALVSGLVHADMYRVRNGAVITSTIATKPVALVAASGGGTREHAVEPERQTAPVLSDSQIMHLEQLGRRIDAHFGTPQDIEWCVAGDQLHILQSRPITTLFPIPEAEDDQNHVYVSVGHQQMMTDAMKPLGLSVWQLTTPRPMAEAGGRLFVDVTTILASPTSRDSLMQALGKSDPLIGDAMRTLLDRGDFIATLPHDAPDAPVVRGTPASGDAARLTDMDAATVRELIARNEASVAALKRDIASRSGPALLDFILDDLQGELKRHLFDPTSHQAIMAGMGATWWLNEKLEEWLGEKNAADTLTQSAPNNVTSEMGLALLDVADAIRPHPQVVAFLEQVDDDSFLDELPKLSGGDTARDAIRSWLDRFGMRCVGEIDITRPRFAERPAALLPTILGHIENFEPGEATRRFRQGERAARAKEQEVLERLRALPDGEQKAAETKRMIDQVRTFAGYREYPKYGMISRYFVYRQALLQEGERLVQRGALRALDDLYFLRFDELHDAVRTQRADYELIRKRRDAYRSYKSLTPPRVLTSEGEAVTGSYRRDDVPAGALAGLAVSAGSIEGRARVVLDIGNADLEPGDILVTAYTDPSWTPLFVSIEGLVTEVGGLMTHGAVIAREYGLPAVVGVENATRLIRDGQRIRVNGTDGYVEILADR